MYGEDLSSTDLHLACNDSLIVGQVAEMAQVDPGDTLAGSRVNLRKLQVWFWLWDSRKFCLFWFISWFVQIKTIS